MSYDSEHSAAVRAAVGRVAEAEAARSELLDEVREFITRFVAFPSHHHSVAVTLWAVHAHAIESFDCTPRLALLSPEPGSGKTRVLEVLELLVPEPLHVLNASAPPIFRTIEKANDGEDRPTLLFDEVDAVFGKRGKDDSAEDLRGLLNAGHRRGTTIPRCVGPRHDVQLFEVFAAVAMAGLGDLPDTLMTRSVVIRMRRRARGEQVEPFRFRLAEPLGSELRGRISAFVKDRATAIERYPELPPEIVDRAADVWEPLLAIADAAGGHWPTTARAAAVELCKVVENREASLGVRLLADLRTVFGDHERMSTEQILKALCELEEAPWGDLRGKPLDPRGLARRLAQYEVKSTKVKIAGASVRGYHRTDLWDAWERYLPDTAEGGTSGTDGTVHVSEPEPVPPTDPVPEPHTTAEPPWVTVTSDVPEVPQVPLAEPECADCGARGTRLVSHYEDDRLLCPDCCLVLFGDEVAP